MSSPMTATTDTTFAAVRRRLAARLRDGAPVSTPRPLELQSLAARDAPALREAPVLEDHNLCARPVAGRSDPRFEAFLDGSQLTLVARWQGEVPIVHGTVSAVIRRRRERRLTTWDVPVVRRALYAPMPLLSADVARAIGEAGVEVVDTMVRRDPASNHPLALQDLAYQTVLAARERAECELAARWCARERGLLFVDGSIAGDAQVARATHVVGVAKSHQTLHAGRDDVPVIMALRSGERSSVLRIEGSGRSAVASWYLRMMDAVGHDPLWGLIRVEVALEAGASSEALTRRADEVSRWILAERLPIAVPDPRWDKMAYGIRDAEEYLRAVQ